MTVKEKIESLIEAANTTTGESATDLTAAVQDLVDGYGGGGSPLPAGYTQMLYIESSGTQYIDTGISPTIDGRVECDFNYEAIGGAYCSAFGMYVDGSNVEVSSSSGGGWYFKFGNSSEVYVSGILAATVKVNLVVDKTSAVFTPMPEMRDLTVRSVAINATSFAATDKHIFLFGASNSSGGLTEASSTRMFRFKYYEGDVLLQDLIPAMRDSDEVLGMYDVIGNQFLTNAGTGTFSGGEL